MDLYRHVRLSLYAVAAAGALALSVAEGTVLHVAVVAGAALAAYAFLDGGRRRPVHPVLLYAAALALLVYQFAPLRYKEPAQHEYLLATAHVLCGLQVLLFFAPYRGAVLLLVGAASLGTVVISGLMNHDVTLLLRMALFVAAVTWAMLAHALWHSHESFRMRRGATATGRSSRLLPQRALWQGLSMSAVMSAACLILGLFLFFSAPRINETLAAWAGDFLSKRDPEKGSGTGRSNGGGPNGAAQDGGLRLHDLDPAFRSRSTALTVAFSRLGPELADGNRRILLRGAAYSQYDGRQWVAPERGDARGGDAIETASARGARPGTRIEQAVAESENLLSDAYHSVGPITRVRVAKVAVDNEGAVVTPDGNHVPANYELVCLPPVHARDLPPDAVAVHEDINRYCAKVLPPNVHRTAQDLVKEITKNCASARQKADAIVAYLRDSGRFTYTLALDDVKRQDDPLPDFLFSGDPKQRRGHCRYFASAFVALCRLEKIPARVAVGFVAPLPAQDAVPVSTAENANKVLFRHCDAHAWGEVFFKDYGWVAFDPTPAGEDAGRGPQTAAAPEAPAAPPGRSPPNGFCQGLWYLLQDMWDSIMTYNSHDRRAVLDRLSDSVRTTLGDVGGLLSGESGAGWTGALLAWAGACVLIYWMMQAFLKRGRRRAARPTGTVVRTQAALAFYNDLLQVLSRRGFVRKAGQTPREFADHVVRHGGERFKDVLVVTQVFEAVRYGGSEMTQDEFNRLQEALDHLRELAFA
jgi:transglutaminase-like putative cysteine protease